MATSPPPTSIEDSLEWTTRTSELIVLGKPLHVSQDTHDDSSLQPYFEENVTIAVDRVLLGVYSSSMLVFRWTTVRARTMEHEVEINEPWLFFLNPARGASSQAAWSLRRSIPIASSSQGLRTAGGDLVRTADAIVGVV
jgi:hypothetical protein